MILSRRSRAEELIRIVIKGKESAKALYEKLGFVEVAVLPRHHDRYGKLRDDIIMLYKWEK